MEASATATSSPVSAPSLLLLLLLTSTVTSSMVDIADLDETWKERQHEALVSSLQAYQPDPYVVNDQINAEVNRAHDDDGNSTRRLLGWRMSGMHRQRGRRRRRKRRRRRRRHTGPCRATNPIDRCWRCDRKWTFRRKRLAKCVLGFGHKTIGGRRGRFYVVRHSSDNNLVNPKPGTLRHAVTRKEPLWIIFARDMVIRLSEELIVASYKTIDGRGANVHIAYGAQITLQFVKHVIIHGIHIHHVYSGGGGMIRDSAQHFGFRTRSDGDGISIFGSSNIWIDHVSMYRCTDGLIDVIEGSTAITISNCHFTRHDHVMLFGASGSSVKDTIMQITVAFNHFGKGLIQRMPRCRYGFFHVLNNDYTHWYMYAIGGSQHPTIISQGNRYVAPRPNSRHNASQVTKREYAYEHEWKHWLWKSENDLMKNGAFFIQSGSRWVRHRFSRKKVISARPGTHAGRLTRYSGALSCKLNRPC